MEDVMYHHREPIESNNHNMMKRAHDSEIVRAKENPKLSYGGPSQRQA